MARSHRISAVLLAGILAVGLVGGCKSFGGSSSTEEKPLFERLGGHEAIVAVVDDFTDRAAKDPAVNFFRKGHTNEWKPTPDQVAHFKVLLVQFIETNTGGPKNYEGRSMAASHQGMGITDAEFGALGADLVASLDKFKVPEKEKAELMAIVVSTKPQIVGK